ncbi:MAG: TVP38/TMEM64 family protein [Proteobacteria bacterium]|nr:TVP38/TMEM64 family protein [Pseudomonadota bacterium]
MSRSLSKKLIVLGVMVGLVVLFFVLGWHRFFTLEQIQRYWGNFEAYHQANPLMMVGLYFLAYIVVTALSLPGATIMTLMGGAIFGFWVSLVTVSFASTIGATAACGVARFVLGEPIQQKYGDKLAAVNRGIEREGAFYLFTLRLVPIFPFFVINLVMGLTRIRLLTYYWVSQVGMLPGTAVYVYAGAQLGHLISTGQEKIAALGLDRAVPEVFDVTLPVVTSDFLRGILSWELILSFVILGIFPLVAKRVIGLIRRRAGRGVAEEKGA